MARTMRRLGAALLLIAALVLLGAAVPRPLWQSAAGGAGERRILVLTNPIHTDIAIPIDAAVRTRFAFLEAEGMPTGDPGARWLVFGWGGRAFYLETPTWADLKPLPALKALTIDRAVMHVDIAGDIAEPHPAVAGYELDQAGFDRLVAFIAQSFEVEGGPPRIVPGAGYGPYDRFYEARGRFNAFVGCNTWTARALREAGLTTGWWNPLPQSLAVSLDLFN
ncbi:MAG: TIGR02117 family protein [Rhizobiaceae bacterium]|nr:MAG: TIGR02117 family protein [Rhizobiaceae bacterium]CAG0955717.1 hypothetical protein RHIZO_00432 [Rhizobiaceae bacterium]